MADNEKRFSFVSLGLPGDTFGVVRFKGFESISQIYEFTIELVSSDPELDMNEVIQNPAKLTILRDGEDIYFNGILTEFEQLHQVGDLCFYRAVLVPKIWWLTQTHFNQVFLDESIPGIIEQVLRSGGLMDGDFDIRLEKDYPQWDYLCQYRESHFSFMNRLMEREGIYYYFEQTPAGERIIITDTWHAHRYTSEWQAYYSPPSGLDQPSRDEVVKNISCRQKMVPRTVRLKDHNWERPSMNVEGSAEVFEEGRGEVYIYGDYFSTPEEGDRLAEIRAEEIRCWSKSFYGDSTIPFFRPGYFFHLANHFRNSFSQTYLVTEISHEGNQASFMLAGLSRELSPQEDRPGYWNSFTAIPSDAQFRPRRETEKPRFHGSLTARIDAAGEGKYAELDDKGRYKVILPFDLSDRQGGKASAPIRMMQPYGGKDFGMHFPLHKGTEVLLTFIDGDPDRPVISGTVSNPDTPSVTTSENQTECNIITSGGNKITFEDKEKHEQILMECPCEESLFKLGYPLDDKKWYQKMGFDGIGGWIGKLIDPIGTLVKAGIDGAQYALGDKDLGMDSGIEMRTNNGLRVAALKKEETIGSLLSPGYCTFGVKGSSMSAVTGLAMDSVTGGRMLSTRGYYSNTILGWKSEKFLGGWHVLNPVAFAFQGEKTEASLVKQELEGQVTKLSASQAEMKGSIEKLQGQLTELNGSRRELTSAVITLSGNMSKLEGQNSTLRGEVQDLVGTVLTIEGEKNQLAGNVQNLQGKVTNLKGDVTNLEGNMVRLSTSSAQVAGATTMI